MLKRFKRNPIALAGFYVVCLRGVMALFADFMPTINHTIRIPRQDLLPDLRSYIVGARIGQCRRTAERGVQKL